MDSDKFGDDESVARLKQVHREVHPFDASKIRSKKAQKLHLQNFDLEHIHPGNLEETSASHQSISRVGNVPNNANEIVRRWNSAEDDLSLIAAVGWVGVCDLNNKINLKLKIINLFLS